MPACYEFVEALVLDCPARVAYVANRRRACQTLRQTRHSEPVRDLLLEFRAEIHHPDPPRAIDIGLFMVAATFRDKLLFGEAPHASPFDPIEPEHLRDEMTRALLCYLRGMPDRAERENS